MSLVLALGETGGDGRRDELMRVLELGRPRKQKQQRTMLFWRGECLRGFLETNWDLPQRESDSVCPRKRRLYGIELSCQIDFTEFYTLCAE